MTLCTLKNSDYLIQKNKLQKQGDRLQILDVSKTDNITNVANFEHVSLTVYVELHVVDDNLAQFVHLENMCIQEPTEQQHPIVLANEVHAY